MDQLVKAFSIVYHTKICSKLDVTRKLPRKEITEELYMINSVSSPISRDIKFETDFNTAKENLNIAPWWTSLRCRKIFQSLQVLKLSCTDNHTVLDQSDNISVNKQISCKQIMKKGKDWEILEMIKVLFRANKKFVWIDAIQQQIFFARTNLPHPPPHKFLCFSFSFFLPIYFKYPKSQ